MTPMKERGEGDQQEGGSGDDQQDKGETWEGTEPLGGSAAGQHYPLGIYSALMSVICSLVHPGLQSHAALELQLL